MIADALPGATREQLAVIEQLLELRVLVPGSSALARSPGPTRRPAHISFLRSHSWSEGQDCDGALVVLGAPYDLNTLPMYERGAAGGPTAIRRASAAHPMPLDLETGAPRGLPDIGTGRRLLTGVSILDAGDLIPRPGCPWSEFAPALADAIAALVRSGARPVVLGGDHSVTLATLQGLCAARPERAFGLLQLDAHTDFGNIDHAEDLTHANVIHHACALPQLVDIVLCGARGIQSVPDIPGTGYTALSPATLRAMDGRNLAAVLRPELPYFVTIDIDVLDPAVAPATAAPEPDGLGLAEARALLVALTRERELLGVDMVEVHERGPGATLTARAAVQLLLEAMDQVARWR